MRYSIISAVVMEHLGVSHLGVGRRHYGSGSFAPRRFGPGPFAPGRSASRQLTVGRFALTVSLITAHQGEC